MSFFRDWADIRIFFAMAIKYPSDLTHDIISFQEEELFDGLRNKQRIVNIQQLVVT